MQDGYAGDIGDFGKFSLLSELAKQGLSTGVNWYKTEPPKTEKKKDGKYIEIPQPLWDCDPSLAEKLTAISKDEENRTVLALEKARLLPGAVYWKEPVSVTERKEWHKKALLFFKQNKIDLVFLDPDNGLLVSSVKKHYARSVKYCFYEEAAEYIKQGFSVLIYNHRCRKPELQYFNDIESKLRSALKNEGVTDDIDIYEITFPRYSVRDYFALARPEHSERIRTAVYSMYTGKWEKSGLCRKPVTVGDIL